MSAQQSFDTLKSFFETRRAAKQAMTAIKEGVEIGLVIGDSVDCALYRKGDDPIIEKRAAVNPDVIFYIKPEAVDVLNGQTKDEIGEIGVNILKEVLAGNISIKVPGKILNLLSRGYLDMLRQGGAPVMAFLARHGLTNVTKITSAIKKMKASKR
jgi:hypothetical protein